MIGQLDPAVVINQQDSEIKAIKNRLLQFLLSGQFAQSLLDGYDSRQMGGGKGKVVVMRWRQKT